VYPVPGALRARVVGTKMQVSILQRQNLALQTSLSCKKRELKDVQHELEQSTSRLRIRETAISVMDRQWMELEQQVARVLAQLNEPVPLPEVASSVLQQLVAPAPLAPGDLEEQLSARCTRMREQHGRLVQAVRALRAVHVAAQPAGGDLERTSTEVDAAATRLQAEHDELARALALAKDQLALAQTAELDLKARLEQSQTEIDKGIKELNRERQRASLETAAAPAARPGSASGDASNSGAAAVDATRSGGAGGADAAALAELREELDASKRLVRRDLSNERPQLATPPCTWYPAPPRRSPPRAGGAAPRRAARYASAGGGAAREYRRGARARERRADAGSSQPGADADANTAARGAGATVGGQDAARGRRRRAAAAPP